MNLADRKIWGYRRDNGRVGVRNYVAILPLDDISNAACEAVAAHIQGTIALPHAYGRLQFGEDLELHFRTMIGTGANPNVAACIVIGIEGGWTEKVVEGMLTTPQAIAQFVRGYAEAGCDELVLFPTVADLDQLDRLADVLVNLTEAAPAAGVAGA